MHVHQSQSATVPVPRVCSVCGTPLTGRRCEGCFLARRRADLSPEAAGGDDAAYVALAEALAAALDAREHETGLHSKRVACHTLMLAKRFSADAATLHQVYWGALLHDIGKIGIPDAILLKQDALTPDEWAVMRQHPDIGQRILAVAPHLALASLIASCHEERFDGSGYPRGLAGEAISLWARLFAVIDTLDAMTSDRPYRKGLSFDDAKAEICRMSGSQFDPIAVQAFLAEEATLREMVALKCDDRQAAGLESPGAVG